MSVESIHQPKEIVSTLPHVAVSLGSQRPGGASSDFSRRTLNMIFYKKSSDLKKLCAWIHYLTNICWAPTVLNMIVGSGDFSVNKEDSNLFSG